MGNAVRPGLRMWDRAVLLVAWTVTCGLVYLLGFYVGRGTQDRRDVQEERVVRLPIETPPPPSGVRVGSGAPPSDDLTFYKRLVADGLADSGAPAKVTPAEPQAGSHPPATIVALGPPRPPAGGPPPTVLPRSLPAPTAPPVPPAAATVPAPRPTPAAAPAPPATLAPPAAAARPSPTLTPTPVPSRPAAPTATLAVATVSGTRSGSQTASSPPGSPNPPTNPRSPALAPPTVVGAPNTAPPRDRLEDLVSARPTAVPTPGDAAKARGWTVALNPTSDRYEAEALLHALKVRGYEVGLVKAQRGAQTQYRVQVGRFDSSQEAKQVAARLRDREGLPSASAAAME